MSVRSDELVEPMLEQLRPHLREMLAGLPAAGLRKLEQIIGDGAGGVAAWMMALEQMYATAAKHEEKLRSGPALPTPAAAGRAPARARSPRSGTASRAR